jgi:membrane protease YdiL (CAAX protease family)
MNGELEGSHGQNWLPWGGLYTAVFFAIIVYVNYSMPYSPGPVTGPVAWQLLFWGCLYLPVLVLPIAAGCKVIDFGFTLSPQLALAFIIVTLLCGLGSLTTRITWSSAVIEAFARTGEEVFFRGLLITLLTRLFNKKRRPWLWAAIASSLIFALAHTQTFQPSFLSQNGYPYSPAILVIFTRLFTVFAVGLVFALVRVWTRSILPGAIAHSIINSGFLALPFVLAIYSLGLLWAYLRGEQVTFGPDA